MKEYPDVRNVGLIGHGGAGKTSLAEAMLFNAKAINRLGNVQDGSSCLDFDPEEIERQISTAVSIAGLEWQKKNINLVDTPGYANFISETAAGLRATGGALLLATAVSGVKSQTLKILKFADRYEIPRLIFINKMDRDRANFLKALGDIEKILGITPLPAQIPMGAADSFCGMVDLISQKAYRYDRDGSGKFKIVDVPDDLAEDVGRYREKLVEAVVETDDDLLTKYLEGEAISEEEIKKALADATIHSRLIPIFCGSATMNIGIQPLLDAVSEYLPSPQTRSITIEGTNKSDQREEREPTPNSHFSAIIFKTVADPHIGKLSIFRVLSGTLKSDSTAYNSTRKRRERIGHIYLLKGKQQKAVDSVKAGDIAAVAKLKDTGTGDTLCDESHFIRYDPIIFPDPVISYAITPKSKGDDEKVSASLHRLMEEDPSIKLDWDKQTKEWIVSGMGQMHIEVIMARLKRRFGVEVNINVPKVPYKETIRSSAKAQGKYKKQTGGRGQYGDTWVEVKPLPRGGGFEFVDKIVGGVIPRQYIPAVEKGVVEAMAKGFLAGYPVVDMRLTLYDGSFHNVDSSEMAFKIAGSMAFKKAAADANPVLLEPVMNMEVAVPDECMGDVIGDLNSRRGKVMGVEPQAGGQNIKAQVPMAEILKYSPNLRSMTSGRGSFHMEFSHYDELPSHLAEKIIEKTKKEKEG
jgi:elongation factor G